MTGQVRTAQKTCRVCAKTKHISAFGRKGSGGRAARCKDCRNAAERRNYEKRGAAAVEKHKAYAKNHHLKYRYGVSPADFDALLARQDGACAICGASSSDGGRRLAVDHDHSTGAIRGLLCRGCNRALGGFKDSPDLLLAAAEYLARGGAK